MWSPQKRHFCAKSIKNSRKQVKNGSFSAVFLVEVAGLELAASSTRSRKNIFSEHFYLHIARIFRKIISFCTFIPLFPYRTFPVVVSYVVKARRTVKSGMRRSLESLFHPLTNRTRVKKNAWNIRLICYIITPKRRKIKSFWWQKFCQLRQRSTVENHYA